jgi:hypothetical protein
MTKTEIASLGGQALVAKYGKEYMRQIGKAGWQATLISLAQRQNIPVNYRGNPFKNLLKNLMAKH